MNTNFGYLVRLSVLIFIAVPPLALTAQTAGAGRPRQPLIKDTIDENKLHTLAGNTRPQANARNDAGRVPDSLGMEHMLLQLRRSSEQEKALRQFIDSLHDSKSPNFHKWLSASELGQTYGATQNDSNTVTNWLESHGFSVNAVYPNGMLIDFSGTALQVREAFHTEIHDLDVNGERHVANMTDPQIPAALAPAVAGVISMHDFKPRSMKKAHADFTFTSRGSTVQAVVPADLAAIYNLNPLFSSGYTGKGQTIAVIEDTDLYTSADWDTFRARFGLSQYSSGSLTTVHPASVGRSNNCAAPGIVSGDDGEAILDAEWASAAAPDAAIMVASCANTRTTFGGLIALQNLINSANPPDLISISYGNCEAENGASANAAFNAAYQQAVAEGISVFVAAGDEGAAGCDAGAGSATHGIGVSGWASTPYNVAVGGTDFADTYSGTNNGYWTSTNSSTYGSATSYIPEIPWNDSCAGGLLAGSFGFTTTYGSDGFCGSSTAVRNKLVNVVAGSGGPSGCATGSSDTTGVVGGTCQGYAKPSWQSGVAGIPNDGVRDLPDISLFAGDGVWGHFYVTCWSDVKAGGAACTGDPSTWGGAGGTSFSAPIMAGIQALVNQKANGRQGNPNYYYYQLAAAGTYTCDASAGDTGASNCIFHNVTQGDIDVNCGGTQNCFGSTAGNTGVPGGRRPRVDSNGALSLSSQSYEPAYATAAGWNFATGIGSVNAYNLANNWPAVR